ELVLRFFSLTESDGYHGGSASQALSETLRRKNDLSPEGIEYERELFVVSLNKCRSAFGDLVFRRWDPGLERVGRNITVALYEAEMLAVREFDLDAIS